MKILGIENESGSYKKSSQTGAFIKSKVELILFFIFFFLFLAFRCQHNEHPFTFQFWKSFLLSYFLEPFSKFLKQQFTSFLELYSSSLELNIGFHLVTIFQEAFGMT